MTEIHCYFVPHVPQSLRCCPTFIVHGSGPQEKEGETQIIMALEFIGISPLFSFPSSPSRFDARLLAHQSCLCLQITNQGTFSSQPLIIFTTPSFGLWEHGTRRLPEQRPLEQQKPLELPVISVAFLKDSTLFHRPSSDVPAVKPVFHEVTTRLCTPGATVRHTMTGVIPFILCRALHATADVPVPS